MAACHSDLPLSCTVDLVANIYIYIYILEASTVDEFVTMTTRQASRSMCKTILLPMNLRPASRVGDDDAWLERPHPIDNNDRLRWSSTRSDTHR